MAESIKNRAVGEIRHSSFKSVVDYYTVSKMCFDSSCEEVEILDN